VIGHFGDSLHRQSLADMIDGGRKIVNFVHLAIGFVGYPSRTWLSALLIDVCYWSVSLAEAVNAAQNRPL